MKKSALIFILIFYSFAAAADTLYTYGGDYVPEWKIQVVYKEKYFENSVYYRNFGVIGLYEEKDSAFASVLQGMKHGLDIRVGLPSDFSINLDFSYLYQKMDSYNFNNLQSLAVFTEKYFDWWGALAGLKAPFWNEMPHDPALIDGRDEFNLMLGLFIRPGPGLFRYSAGLYDEICLLPGRNYRGSMLASASAGLNIYTSEEQNIDFNLEAAYSIRFTDGVNRSVLYLTPQFYVEFFNDFYFIIGVEFYLAASEIYINDYRKPRYLVKLNYTANSDKRTVKPKEAIKKEIKDKKPWQIEGVDDEMIPETWKVEEPDREEAEVEK